MTYCRTAFALAAIALSAAPFAASAKNATGTLQARVRVDTSCRLTAQPMTFGSANIFSGQIDTTSEIKLSCGPAVAYSVSIDNGLYFNGNRRMFSGSVFFSYVNYQIYRNAARTLVWGSTAGTVESGITPVTGDVTLTAYGRVPNSIVLPRVYRDTVTVTVTF